MRTALLQEARARDALGDQAAANPTDATTVLLNTFTPDLYVEYFRDLRDMIAAGRPLTPDTTVEAMSRYATEPASDFA